HPAYYQDMATRIAGETGAFFVDQFTNPANPRAHETTTGPEILGDLSSIGLGLDAMVCGVGSGGTITGLGRYFEANSPATEMVLADPEGSILHHYVKTGEVSTDVGSWAVEGIGEDFIPRNAELQRVKAAYTVSDQESFLTARDLLSKEGILAGSSSGTLIAAALRYCRDQTTEKVVCTFVCDSGNKYLSKMFNDFWLADEGFVTRDQTGDLRDLVSRRHDLNEVITVESGNPLNFAYRKMRLYEISQIPVMRDGTLIGLIDEDDLLERVCEQEGSFAGSVDEVMSTNLLTIDSGQSRDALLKALKSGLTAIITHNGAFFGLVTRIDLLNAMSHHR
ncbi:MAG: pyridoxal-phosphate dependent enzyme, partial [Pseudomonadota bacterium]